MPAARLCSVASPGVICGLDVKKIERAPYADSATPILSERTGPEEGSSPRQTHSPPPLRRHGRSRRQAVRLLLIAFANTRWLFAPGVNRCFSSVRVSSKLFMVTALPSRSKLTVRGCRRAAWIGYASVPKPEQN